MKRYAYSLIAIAAFAFCTRVDAQERPAGAHRVHGHLVQAGAAQRGHARREGAHPRQHHAGCVGDESPVRGEPRLGSGMLEALLGRV